MFCPHYAICKCHNQQRLIVVKAGFCREGNEAQKKAKKKSAGKSTAKYAFKREPTGEGSVFEAIASSRDWVCFVTGEPLRELTASNFIHVLPKALNRYPRFKLNPDNIVLGTAQVHYKWDKEPRSSLTEPFWKKMFDLETELKAEYNKLTVKWKPNQTWLEQQEEAHAKKMAEDAEKWFYTAEEGSALDRIWKANFKSEIIMSLAKNISKLKWK